MQLPEKDMIWLTEQMAIQQEKEGIDSENTNLTSHYTIDSTQQYDSIVQLHLRIIQKSAPPQEGEKRGDKVME